MKLKDACSLEKNYDKPKQHIERQRHHFADKGPRSQSYNFSSSHVWMWELGVKKAEHWRTDAFKLWCWRRLLRVPWTARRSVNLKRNQLWIFIGRTDAGAETPIFWPLEEKSLLFVKDPNAGKDWRQEEKGEIEDDIIGEHHWLNGHEFEQNLGDSEGQGSYSSWGHKETGLLVTDPYLSTFSNM